MSLDNWFRWPTNSSDPALNAAIVVLLAMTALMVLAGFVAFAVIIAIPAGILFAAYKFYTAHLNRPVAISDLHAADQERVARAAFPSPEDFLRAHLTRFLESRPDSVPPQEVYDAIADVAGTLYRVEDLSNPLPPLAASSDLVEEARYRDSVLAHMRKLDDPDETLRLIHQTLGRTEAIFMDALPPFARLTDEQFVNEDTLPATIVRVLDAMADVRGTVHDIVALYFAESLIEHGLFAELRDVLDANVHRMSSVNMPAPSHTLVLPANHDGTDREIVDGYLAGTPLRDLFHAAAPFVIPEHARMEHTFILGGSGAGKTTLLQQLILDDLAKPDPPPMVVIDPKGQLVERIQRLEVFNPDGGRLADRLVIVDPHQSPPPALNMFHAAERWRRVADFRQRMEGQAISNFAYIFSTIESPLTQKQTVCFTFCVRLLFSMERADIRTLVELLDDPARRFPDSRFNTDIQRLDPISRRFFENDFYSPDGKHQPNFGETRQQIKARLYGILQHPQILAMFSTPERKIDLFDCLQRKDIVLVNGAIGAPGSDASQLFCRYFVALTLNAAFERVVLHDRKEWHPAYLIIDEFQLVADELKTPEMLRLAREYNLGIVMAFQEIHGKPFNDSLRASLSTNTSIKYASSPEGVDINYAARDLRCHPDFVRGQTKTATHARFACFVRGYLDHPVSISVPFGNIQREPQMPQAALNSLLAANRARLRSAVGGMAQTAPSAEPSPTAPQPSVPPLPEPEAAPDTSPASTDKPRVRRW